MKLNKLLSPKLRDRLRFCQHYIRWNLTHAKQLLSHLSRISEIIYNYKNSRKDVPLLASWSGGVNKIPYKPIKLTGNEKVDEMAIKTAFVKPQIYGRPGFWYTRLKKRKWFYSCFIAKLDNVYLSDLGRVFDAQGGSYIQAWHRRDFRFKHLIQNRLYGVRVSSNLHSERLIEKVDKVIVLTQSSGSLYGHFLIEVLPRLAMLEEENLDEASIYVGLDHAVYEQALGLLGVTSKQIINANYHPLILAQRAIVPCYRQVPCVFAPSFVKGLYSRIVREAAKRTSSYKGDRLYVARSGDSSRDMCNVNEVEEILLDYGFTKIFPETMSFDEQVVSFSKAKVVIGMHGSGMFNTVFCSQETIVFDLFPACVNGMLYCVLHPLGIRYIPVQSPDGSMVNWSMRQSFNVDLDSLHDAFGRNQIDKL